MIIVVGVDTKEQMSDILRFYELLGFSINITSDEFNIYKRDTGIAIDLANRTIDNYSSINFYIDKQYPIISYDAYIDCLKCDNLVGFPLEVIMAMIIQQKSQGNKPNLSIFTRNKNACKEKGGFDWGKTVQGIDYWGSLISDMNFENFKFIEAARIK